MKAICKISVIIAGAMLLLHTLLPHEHHQEILSYEHVEAQSFLDFIELAFHLDQGEGHLELYENVNESHPSLEADQMDIEIHDMVCHWQIIDHSFVFTVHSVFPQQSYFQSIRFRGPPLNG